jgi:hypothetical protein
MEGKGQVSHGTHVIDRPWYGSRLTSLKDKVLLVPGPGNKPPADITTRKMRQVIKAAVDRNEFQDLKTCPVGESMVVEFKREGEDEEVN